MSTALARIVNMVDLICHCGTPFSAPDELFTAHREGRTSQSIHCPLGHGTTWGKTEIQRLRDQLVQKENELEFARSQRDAAERREKTTKSQMARLNRRIGNGVCPKCKRHFTNVERHMKTKHPTEER